MNRINYQTTIDGGCHPVSDKFDHAVNSPSYSSHSRHSLQHNKMPALLLRLDSEGEVTTVNLPSESLSPVNSRQILHSQSFESDIVSKTARRLFSSSAMAKLLCSKNSGMPPSVQIEAHSLGHKSHPANGAFYGMKTYSSSFDSCPKTSLLHDINAMLMPSKINEYNLFGSHNNHQAFKDLDASPPPTGLSCSLSSSIFSIAKACAVCQTSSSGCSVSASAQSTLSDTDSPWCNTVLPEIPVAEVICHKCDSNTASVSASLDTCASDESDLSVIFQQESWTDELNSKGEIVATKGLTEDCVASNECKQTEEYSSSCDKLQCDICLNSTSAASPSSVPSAADLSSVLLLPRKTTKKGRPSSRKQRKRQREKQKNYSVPSVSEISASYGAEKRQHFSHYSQSAENTDSSILFEASCSVSPGSAPRESTPVKSQAKHCPIASFFFGDKSDSEEIDDSDDSEDTGEWSVSQKNTLHTLSKKCAGFNSPLCLDSIFKKKSIPTLKSVFWAEDSESESEASPAAEAKDCQSVALDVSIDNHSGDSSINLSSPVSSPSKSLGFTCGLSLEALFNKKPDLVGHTATKESLLETVSGVPSNGEDCHLSTSLEMCYESISRINARWNQDYPSAGFRSCVTVSSDEIKDPSIKVHFASGPSFLTTHFIGTEERGGTWHHFALDRERFQRRILDLSPVLSAVLETSHRAKIMKRNQEN